MYATIANALHLPALGNTRYWRTVRLGGRAFMLAVLGFAATIVSQVIIPSLTTIGELAGGLGYLALIMPQVLLCLHGMVLRSVGVPLHKTWPLTFLSALIACVSAVVFSSVVSPTGVIAMVGLLFLVLTEGVWSWVAYIGLEMVVLVGMHLVQLPWMHDVPTITILHFAMIYLVGGIAARALSNLATHSVRLAAAKAQIAHMTAQQERDRISRDLHDRLGHNLVTIMLRTELAWRIAPEDSERSEKEVRAAHLLARQALEDMRRIAHDALTADLDAELTAAVELLESHGVVCRIRIGDQPEGEAADVLAWVVLEAVTNILRHSEPKNCTLELVRVDNSFRFTIENDGLSHTVPASAGFGLTGIGERVERIGGTSSTEVAGGWFRLRVSVPACDPAPEDSLADASSHE